MEVYWTRTITLHFLILELLPFVFILEIWSSSHTPFPKFLYLPSINKTSGGNHFDNFLDNNVSVVCFQVLLATLWVKLQREKSLTKVQTKNEVDLKIDKNTHSDISNKVNVQKSESSSSWTTEKFPLSDVSKSSADVPTSRNKPSDNDTKTDHTKNTSDIKQSNKNFSSNNDSDDDVLIIEDDELPSNSTKANNRQKSSIINNQNTLLDENMAVRMCDEEDKQEEMLMVCEVDEINDQNECEEMSDSETFADEINISNIGNSDADSGGEGKDDYMKNFSKKEQKRLRRSIASKRMWAAKKIKERQQQEEANNQVDTSEPQQSHETAGVPSDGERTVAQPMFLSRSTYSRYCYLTVKQHIAY